MPTAGINADNVRRTTCTRGEVEGGADDKEGAGKTV